MTETADKTYKVKADNTADTTPNLVAVTNDGMGDRQIVVLGAGDGTTNINDGSLANPINTSEQLADIYLALKEMINILARPTWLDPNNGALRVNFDVSNTAISGKPAANIGGIWTSITSPQSAVAPGNLQSGSFSPTDSWIHPMNRQSFGTNIRERIN
jgi:hypothetical protein